jgi:CRP/FNR family cyclic AMP-dependent transcriptional regulator
MDETIELERLPIFRNMPAQQLAPLRRAATRLTYMGNAAIFRQGDIPQFLYIVEEGEVDIVLPAVGDDIIAATFEGGSFFGELGVFDNQPRTATARAACETTLILVPLAAVAELIENHPPAARQFMSVVIERLRRADEMLSRLQIRNINEVADKKMTFGERIADMVARFGGSWTFIIVFGVFLLAWMGVNTAFLLAAPPDPFPYIFLNLILSCLAALQAPVIMMSQNRQASKDRLQADQDYRVNIKAEFAIQQLHRKIDELRANLAHLHRGEARGSRHEAREKA